jgi:membrane protease YdiL (CAAX protease family)
MRPRNSLIVVAWTFGLFVLVHTTQYVYFWLGSAVTGAAFGKLAGGEIETSQTVLIRGLVGLLLGIPAIFLVAKFLWRRPWRWLRLEFDVRLLLLGSIIGIAAGLAVVAVLGVLGFARVAGFPSRFSEGQLTAVMVGHVGWVLFTATLEEVIFRGMAVREFALRWGWPLATVVGGVYFAAIHLIAIVPMLTPLLIVGILVAGTSTSAMFVALYVRSRSLWLPIGFHAGWNFALSAIAGTTMSGRGAEFGLLQVEMSGRALLTGGEFGVELSVVAVALTVIVTICTLFMGRRQASELLPSRPWEARG